MKKYVDNKSRKAEQFFFVLVILSTFAFLVNYPIYDAIKTLKTIDSNKINNDSNNNDNDNDDDDNDGNKDRDEVKGNSDWDNISYVEDILKTSKEIPSQTCNRTFSLKSILHTRKEVNTDNDDNVLLPPCSHEFHPVRFFNDYDSPGFKYKEKLPNLRAMVTGIGTHYTSFQFSHPQTKSKIQQQKVEFNSENVQQNQFYLFYMSLPKAASSSTEAKLRDLNDKTIINNDGHNVHVRYHGMLPYKQSMVAMQTLNMENVTSQAKVLTIMRDPVSRFVSAIGQEMNLKTARAGRQFREKCLKVDKPKETLQCAIDHVKDCFSGNIQYPLQIHFTPAATVYYKRMFQYDLPLEVIDFKDVNAVLDDLSLLDGKTMKNDHTVHLNDHKDKDDQLAKLNVSELNDEMIKQICKIYAVDVLIMRHLNLEDKYCKELQP